MNPDDLAKILDELGERLGPTGAHVFQLAVQYKVTDSLVGIALAAAYLVGFALFVRWAIPTAQKGDYGDDGFLAMMGTLIGTLIAAFAFFVIGSDLVTLLNPEYAAIRDILGAVR